MVKVTSLLEISEISIMFHINPSTMYETSIETMLMPLHCCHITEPQGWS